MSNNDKGFLGRPPQFNKVGADVAKEMPQEAVEEGKQQIQPYHVRNAVTVLVILALLIVIFFISNPGGVATRSTGRATIDPAEHQVDVDR